MNRIVPVLLGAWAVANVAGLRWFGLNMPATTTVAAFRPVGGMVASGGGLTLKGLFACCPPVRDHSTGAG